MLLQRDSSLPAQAETVAGDAKRAKAPDLAAIKKQIEYYFSDQNLKGDK